MGNSASRGIFDTSLVSERDPNYNRLKVESDMIKQDLGKSLAKYHKNKSQINKKNVSKHISEGVQFNNKVREEQSKVTGVGAHSDRQQWDELKIATQWYLSQIGIQSGSGKRRKVSKRRKAPSKNKRKKTKRKKTNKK